MKRIVILGCISVISLLVMTALLVGCQPAAAPPEEEVTPEEVTTEEVPAAEEVTLTLWYLSQSPEEIQLIQDLADKFAERHPGLSIDFSAYGFDDMLKTLKLALDAGTGPDVAYAAPILGVDAYVKGGHLVELTEFAKELGWDERFSADTIRYWNRNFPEGAIYGMPYDLTAVGVFYNKEIFDAQGLQPPQTFEEFEAILAKLKEAGITPISVGGLDGWPLTHVWQQLVHANVPWDRLDKLQDLSPDEVWNAPDIVETAARLKEWVDKGYFNENLVATSYDDANNLFITGQVAMNIGGTWNNTTFAEQTAFEPGFFPMPRMNPDIEWHMGGYTPNNVWILSKYSQHQDLGIEFIDYMLSEEAARALWDSGDIAAYRFAEVPAPKFPLQSDVYQAMQITKTGTYFDYPSALVMDAQWAAMQKLAAGETTPQEAMDMIQEAYAKLVAELGKQQ